MLTNFLLGLPTMVLCLMLQTVLLVLVIRYFYKHWAWMFKMLGEFEEFGAAFYHSAVNFGSLGYGDVVMSDEHKLLGALEAINGVIMIGVSTAALMTVFQGVTRKLFAARKSS
jgi:hypothetical protein